MDKVKPIALEWEETLRVLAEQNRSFTELSYFLDIARAYARPCGGDPRRPRVIPIGHFFPDEILLAMGVDLCCVFGGSYESTLHPDVNIPKDCDDETRSLIGLLRSDAVKLRREDVVLLPFYNDSMKKLKPLIEDLADVICFEIPSDREDPLQRRRFSEEIGRVTGELKKRFGKKLSSRKLKEQCRISRKAAEAFAELEALCRTGTVALTASALLLVAGSYRMSRDRAEWTARVTRLTEELRAGGAVPSSRPAVLLFGSPIYLPQYKVLFAAEEAGLRIHTLLHPDIELLLSRCGIEPRSATVKGLAARQIDFDLSPFYIRNPAMERRLTEAAAGGVIRGMIAHILKGQILFDHESRHAEQTAAESRIPLIRIETVYGGSDSEQIRLRTEAFSEMLTAPRR